jgi:hypothetical protein
MVRQTDRDWPAVAGLVERQRVVVMCEKTPPLAEQIAIRVAGHDGALCLIGTVRCIYNLRTCTGRLKAFLVRVDNVLDDPGPMALLGKERAAVLAH